MKVINLKDIRRERISKEPMSFIEAIAKIASIELNTHIEPEDIEISTRYDEPNDTP